MFTRFPHLCRAQQATRAHLYETLGSWMRHVAEDKLQVYVERLGVQHFREERAGPVCQALLRGLAQAMALPNPPKHCWALLCSTTEKIFSILPDRVQVGLFYSANVPGRTTSSSVPHVAPGPQVAHLFPFFFTLKEALLLLLLLG